ncbi:MAG: VOC family protein [Anaerolineae bacterium]
MQLDKFTIAVTDMTAMVAFYNAVFDAELKSIPDSPFFAGKIAGVDLLFCPNEIAQVVAEKNRIQMLFTVGDVEAVVASAAKHGGGDYGDRHETDTLIGWGIYDPDGNSIELRELK